MHALAAGSWVFAVLLAIAGGTKVLTPAATAAALQGARLPSDARLVRLLGLAEVALGVVVLTGGGVLPAALLCVAYITFAGFAWRQSRKGEGCGCFGEATAPATTLHVAINVLGAALAALAVVWPPPPLLFPASGAVATLLTAALAVLGALVVRLALTALPELATATAALGGDA